MTYLNARVPKRPKEVIVNPEGAFLFKEKSDRNLFSIASAFKLRNTAYWNAKEVLKSLEQAIDSENDLRYKAGLARFLSEFLGIRLSPIIILSRISQVASTLNEKNDIAKSVKHVMDRPDKIANAIAYAQYSRGSGKDLPPYFKRALKTAFESFDAYTLKKFKLRRKIVKTADVIKLLHPKPRNIGMSKLYKAIIENSKESAIEKDTVIAEVLSNAEKTLKEKSVWVSSNISKIPLNALLRNLNSVVDSFENLEILEKRLLNAVRTINGYPVVKVFNPFDLFTLLDEVSIPKQNVILKVLETFISYIDLGISDKNISFLVDISGSMAGNGLNITRKYMSILLPILSKRNKIVVHSFNTSFYNIEGLPQHSVCDVYSNFGKHFSAHGGTALVDSIAKTVVRDRPDLLVVFSDEITWADRYADVVLDIGIPVIAVNPAPYSQGTVFNPDKPIVKLCSLDAKILYYMPALVNFSKFKTWIKSLV